VIWRTKTACHEKRHNHIVSSDSVWKVQRKPTLLGWSQGVKEEPWLGMRREVWSAAMEHRKDTMLNVIDRSTQCRRTQVSKQRGRREARKDHTQVFAYTESLCVARGRGLLGGNRFGNHQGRNKGSSFRRFSAEISGSVNGHPTTPNTAKPTIGQTPPCRRGRGRDSLS